MSKIYGYVRVSTRGQLENNSIENQLAIITDKYPSAGVYEEAFSAKNNERPQLTKLLNKLLPGDLLVVTKLDRLCRSTKEGLSIIENLLSKGIKIHILNMGLIEDSPIGKLIVTNLLAFAEFERAMIIERTQSGRTIAKTKNGYKEGRPKKFTEDQLNYALSLLIACGGNYTYNEVVKKTQISRSTLMREVRKRRKDKNE